MITTFITDKNAGSFLPAVSNEALIDCDLFIGVIDEAADMAVGVLGAEAVYDHSLAIRFIYVDDNYRRLGAGTALIKRLKDVAFKLNAASLVCTHIRSEESDGVYELLEACGFMTDAVDVPVYASRLEDIEIKSIKSRYTVRNLKSVYVEEWAELMKDWSMGSIKGGNGEPADIYERSFYDPLHSYLAYSGSSVAGELLCVREPEGIWVTHLGARGDDANAIMHALILKAVTDAGEDLAPDTRIFVSTDSPRMLSIFNNLTKDQNVRTGDSITQFCEIMS